MCYSLRGETTGGMGGAAPPPPPNFKKQILSGKFMAAIVSVGQIWKFSLGRTFIATFCPSLVFKFMVFSPIFFSISAQLGKQNRNEARNSNINTFLSFVHRSALSSRARCAHVYLRLEMKSELLIDSESIDGK